MSFGIAAAGTGGHVFPALAVGEALVAAGVSQDQVHFFGGDRLEATVFPAAGFPFHPVELRGLQRQFTMANLGLPMVVARSVRRLRSLMRSLGVQMVLGMGGYVTPPVVVAARSIGAAAAVSEQNAEAGLGNRLGAVFGAVAYGAFPATAGLKRARWVGNPVRSDLVSFDREAMRPSSRRRYGLVPDVPTVGVVGGSLGAGSINAAVAEMARGWSGPPVQILHLVGDRFLEEMQGLPIAANVEWQVVGFEERMAHFYAACDLVVARAGGAVAELSATATPAILVPGVFGSGRHQVENAKVFADHGAAMVLPQDQLERLGAEVSALLSDPVRLDRMRSGLTALAKPDAAAIIASEMQSRHD